MNSSSQLSASINQTKKKNKIHNRNRQRRRLYGTWLGEGATHDSKMNLIRRIDQTLEAIGCWPATRRKKMVGIRLARGKRWSLRSWRTWLSDCLSIFSWRGMMTWTISIGTKSLFSCVDVASRSWGHVITWRWRVQANRSSAIQTSKNLIFFFHRVNTFQNSGIVIVKY